MINVQYYSASVLFYVQIQCYRQLTECSDRTTSKCRLSACGSVDIFFFLKFEGLTTTLRRRIAMIGPVLRVYCYNFKTYEVTQS